MIYLKTDEEIELMRAANLLVGRTLAEVAKIIAPGVSTLQLDKRAEEFIRDNGATPAFLGYNGFPGSLCTSVNDHVVHGIPSSKVVLKDGDIVSVDCGTKLAGFTGDSAYTFAVGEVAPETLALLRTTKESLYIGIEHAVAGKRVVISALRSSSIVKHVATISSANLKATGSGRTCMRSQVCPTSGAVARGLSSALGCASASSQW